MRGTHGEPAPKRFGLKDLEAASSFGIPAPDALGTSVVSFQDSEDAWRTVEVRAIRTSGSPANQPLAVLAAVNAQFAQAGDAGPQGTFLFDVTGIGRASFVCKSCTVQLVNRTNHPGRATILVGDGYSVTQNQLCDFQTGAGEAQEFIPPNCTRYLQVQGVYSGAVDPSSYSVELVNGGGDTVVSATVDLMPAGGWPLAGIVLVRVTAPNTSKYRLTWVLDR